jgi:hypothetical protein
MSFSPSTPTPAPPVLVSNYPKLTSEQAGHLRHFHNLVSQPDGEWHHFGTVEGQQEWDDAYRYQLATMTYAAGVTHYRRLPAMRSTFKTLMRRMIHKMLRREVWGYWFTTSHGGNLLDPDLTELRKPWADPVIKENIMYSGHLLLMTSLYAMLFDDDEFEKKGSLTFSWSPLFWGMGKQDFVYDNRGLQKVIFQQMEDNDWVGVCCEPNAVFVVCNQFPVSLPRGLLPLSALLQPQDVYSLADMEPLKDHRHEIQRRPRRHEPNRGRTQEIRSSTHQERHVPQQRIIRQFLRLETRPSHASQTGRAYSLVS